LSTWIDGGPCPPAPEMPPEPAGGVDLPAGEPAAEPLAVSVRRRRSALDYDPAGRTSLQQFAGLLAEAACLPHCDALGNLAAAPGRALRLRAPRRGPGERLLPLPARPPRAAPRARG
ncbi:MAG TPA: hypothetical protein VFF36_17325, partial [Planctomycetota bacterium]|nr:hypothetical protein [Planctomycetota bacterium]